MQRVLRNRKPPLKRHRGKEVEDEKEAKVEEKEEGRIINKGTIISFREGIVLGGKKKENCTVLEIPAGKENL
ncbi:hypothetical protein VTN49DRAFT_1532 [Thermomyces lanuginosus]|uniref:uncharacterized protein n=1 Tax=Thermomyces lanuginosus TaxID=5541 RepID=UPI003742814F